MWTRRITKFGDSLTVSLAPILMKALGWKRGDHIMMRIQANGIVEMKKFDTGIFSEKELLDEISPPEIHV